MLKFVQRFLEKTANFFVGDYINRQEESYETILKALDGKKEPEIPPDEVHQLNQKQMKQAKREFFSKALQGGIASLYLDPRVEGVIVPEKFRGSPTLVLNYSYRYHIADFDFDDERVVASLSFGGFPFQCVVPWDAVIGIGNQAESTFYSFISHAPHVENKTPIENKSSIDDPVFDQASHDRAIERRKQFQVIKGEKE